MQIFIVVESSGDYSNWSHSNLVALATHDQAKAVADALNAAQNAKTIYNNAYHELIGASEGYPSDEFEAECSRKVLEAHPQTPDLQGQTTFWDIAEYHVEVLDIYETVQQAVEKVLDPPKGTPLWIKP